MTPDFSIERLTGNTVRFTIANLADLAGTPITSGGSVAINLLDDAGTLVTTGTVVQLVAPDNSTYYADITLPSVTTTRRYKVQCTASKSGMALDRIGFVWVFPV